MFVTAKNQTFHRYSLSKEFVANQALSAGPIARILSLAVGRVAVHTARATTAMTTMAKKMNAARFT